MWVETALSAAELGAAIWDKSGPVLKRLRKIKNFIRSGHVRIAVFGLGGIGKTTLGEFLSGKAAGGTAVKPYELSYKTEQFPVDGDAVCTLIVPGGQERRIQNDWPEIYRMLAKGKSRGIINLVSWGHHSFADIRYTDTRYFHELTAVMGNPPSKEEFLQAYLEDRRKAELNILRELMPHIKVAKGKLWMVTLITKQDLWWKQRNDVAQHYRDGEYDSMIQEIAKIRGEQNFAHEYASVALVMNNFQTRDGEVLIPTAEGYDQNLQYSNLANFLRIVTAFIPK